MQTIRNGYRGLSLLFNLNWDLIVSVIALALALIAGAWLASHGGALPRFGPI